MATHSLKVGQELWCVPERGNPHSVTITAIGRKWATLDGGRNRVDVTTLRIDGRGYHTTSRCYLRESDYTESVKVRKTWEAFERSIRFILTPKVGVTVENIREAARLLGVPLAEDEAP